MRVGLENMSFFAYHGYYEEERRMGQHFTVTVFVDFDSEIDGKDELSDTFNYEWILEVTAAEMKKTRKLLETVAYFIVKGLKEKTLMPISGKVIIRKPEIVMPISLDGSYVEYEF